MLKKAVVTCIIQLHSCTDASRYTVRHLQSFSYNRIFYFDRNLFYFKFTFGPSYNAMFLTWIFKNLWNLNRKFYDLLKHFLKSLPNPFDSLCFALLLELSTWLYVTLCKAKKPRTNFKLQPEMSKTKCIHVINSLKWRQSEWVEVLCIAILVHTEVKMPVN